jgi:hypothetical protein
LPEEALRFDEVVEADLFFAADSSELVDETAIAQIPP